MIKIRGMHPRTLLAATLAGVRSRPSPNHVFLCVADHFEPDWHGASRSTQQARVQRWVNEYPKQFREFHDSRNRHPQHTFFYPVEVYDAEHIDRLCSIVNQGLGDVEIHLHHDNDCSENLYKTLEEAIGTLHDRHGLLSRDSKGKLRYGFIHGNWALDNSHPSGRWCGVNDELTVLKNTGCYADFTMPAAPHAAQTDQINSIYYAKDAPDLPKSHNTGTHARLNAKAPEESLLMIQGPLSVVLDRKRYLPKPQVENGNLSASQPPNPNRIVDWLKAGVSVVGRPDWLFVKLHTHGAQELNAECLLGEPMCSLHRGLSEQSKIFGFNYYYVTAREMAQLVHQAEQGTVVPDFAQLSW